MRIEDFLREDLILPDLRARRKGDVLRELSDHLSGVEGIAADEVVRVLLDREKLGSTALAEGIAIPHAKLESAKRLIGCVARSRKGVAFGSEDGSPTHLFFVLIAPPDSTGDHLKALARISRLFHEPSTQKRLMAAETAGEMLEILIRQDGAGRQ